MSTPLAAYTSGGLEAKEIYDGIYKIDNFLLPEEINALRSQADTATQADWERQYHKQIYDQAVRTHGADAHEAIEDFVSKEKVPYWTDKVVAILDTDLRDRINSRLEPFFSGLYEVDTLLDIQRQYEGVGLDEHVDAQHDPRIKLAVAIYINDDFGAGELYFPKKGIEIKPEAGSCVIFATTEDYLHGVKPLLPGPSRYALVGFAWELGTTDHIAATY